MEIIKKSWLILKKKNRSELFKLVFLNFLVVFLELLTLSVFLQTLKIYSDPSEISKLNSITNFSKSYFNVENTLAFIVVIFFIIYIIKSLVLIYFYSRQFKFTYDLKAQFASKVFRYYLNAPYNFHLKNNPHDLIRNIGNEVTLVSNGIVHQLIVIGSELLIIFSIMSFLMVTNPTIILQLIFYFLLISVFYYSLVSKKIRNLGNIRQAITTDVLKKTLDSIYGIKDTKILSKENYFSSLFEKTSYSLSNLNRIISIFSQVPKVIIEVSLIGIITLMVFNYDGDTLISSVGIMLFAGLRLMPSFSKVVSSLQSLKYNQAAMNVVFNILDTSKYLNLEKKNEHKLENINFKKKISFIRVRYNYENDNDIFENLNLEINKGDKIGIIGKSGSGKSTFVDLLSGLLTPTSGKILVDENELKEKTLESWQQKIGYVPQKVHILDDKLKFNIAYGVKEEEINYIKLKSIIEKTNLREIRSNEKNIDIMDIKISDRGLNISGGELQRIALARSLYNDSEILILDEATNSLDELNKKKLIDNIYDLYNDKTVIFISHEENVFDYCNKIYELKNKNFINIK